MFKQGDLVKIVPAWQDEGDDLLTWVVKCDEIVDPELGTRVHIQLVDLSNPLPPSQLVKAEWIEHITVE
jgi:hypothetical protein